MDGPDLIGMLSTLAPRLVPGEFVFCTVPSTRKNEYAGLSPLATFCEDEGLTLVIDVDSADKACLDYSALDSVGLTAAVSTQLAQRGISANVIAAYHHDHIFVLAQQAEEAVSALREFGVQCIN
jgi:uncharacterized protein